MISIDRSCPFHLLLIVCLLVLVAQSPARAQELPFSTTPRGLVFAFLTETASSVDTIDRRAFRPRFTGELAKEDPMSWKGMIPPGSRIRIDTIPDLPTSEGGYRHAVAYVTVEKGKAVEQYYIFCMRDSIWRMEVIRRFPERERLAQMEGSLTRLDSTTLTYRQRRFDIDRLRLSDDSLRALFHPYRAAAEKIVAPLMKGRRWGRFALRDVDFTELEEYRELDDDIDRSDMIFYTIDRPALERLKNGLGVRRIERDERHPEIVLFVGASISNDAYGYLYTPDPAYLPTVTSDDYMMLKPIADRWWLYKRAAR